MCGVSNATNIVCCIIIIIINIFVKRHRQSYRGSCYAIANVVCCIAIVKLGNDDHCSRINYSVRLLSSLRTVVSLRRVQVGA